MKAKILLGVIVGVATATAAACLSSAAEAADDIVIGFAVAQSGPVAGYDDNGTKTAQIFIDDVNAKGGVLGKKLRAVFADTKSDRAEGAKAGQEVVSQGPIWLSEPATMISGHPPSCRLKRQVRSLCSCAPRMPRRESPASVPIHLRQGLQRNWKEPHSPNGDTTSRATETSTSFSTTA